MAAEFPLDPQVFWKIVADFAKFDYSFIPDKGEMHAPDPSAKPGYPGAIIRSAKSRAPGLATTMDAEAVHETNYLGRCYTNCCMFVEAVLIGTALQTHADFGEEWDAKMHDWAMNIATKGDAQFGPPRAYAAVGIADDLLDIAATSKLVPGEIYVVQGLGHTWFIVDCDENGLCLRLEATFANALHPELEPCRPGTDDRYGGVVHGGFRRVGAKPERSEWVAALRARPKTTTWEWTTLQAALLADLAKPGGAAYVGMARVRMQPMSSGPWLPYEMKDGSGRSLDGQAALAEAWRRTLAAEAPFPLGSNRTWHNGIHIDATIGTAVLPFASGELVAARFPEAIGDVDQGSVILRHRFDRRLLAFLAIDEPPREDEVTFFSAIVHLQGGADGAARLVDHLCPKPETPVPSVPPREMLDVFVFDSEGVVHELAALAWTNERSRSVAAAVEMDGIAPRLVVHLEDNERYAQAWNPAAPGRAAVRADVTQRLRAGTSRLVALPIGAGGITVGVDGCVRAAEGVTELVAHHVLLRNKAGAWWLDTAQTLTLPVPPATLAWPVLGVLQPGKSSVRAALVEVVLAAPRDRFDDGPLHVWERIEALRARVKQDLVAGWVDFAAVERDDPEQTADMRWRRWRWLGRAVIGTSGRPAPDRKGVHLEVFAATNFLDRSIANGRWDEIGADIDAPPRTPEFERAVETMLSRGRIGQLIHAQQARDELAAGARRPSTWMQLCNHPDVAALLAELVAVHTNEWTTSWAEVVTARDAGGPGLAHAPLADAWPTDAAFGLPTGKLRYYHPLRLFEWLTTGVRVRVRLLGSKPADVDASLMLDGDPGDASITLRKKVGGDQATFFERAVLARSIPTDAAFARTARVAVHHTATTAVIPEVSLTLRRGEITRLELCEPGAVVMRVGCGTGTDNGFLLADAGQRFATAACNRVGVAITLLFNRDRPAKVELSLDHPSFSIVPSDSDAYTKSGDAKRCTFVPRAGTIASAIPTAQQVQLFVAIACRDAVGIRGKLTVTIAGADGNPGITKTIEVGTRELGVAADERGRDVEKLQIYLTRIHAEGAPCLVRDRKAPTDPWIAGAADGRWRSATASALWRFVVAFGGKWQWAQSFTRIACEKGEYEIPNALFGRQLDVPSPLGPDARRDALDAEAKRLMTRYGRPHVGAPMIAELVRCAAMPHVLPSLTLAIGTPSVAPALTAAAASLSAKERALLLPFGALAPEAAAKIVVTAEAVAGDPSAVTLDVVLTGGAYVLDADATRPTLAELLARGLTLRPSGVVDNRAHVIELRSGKAVLGKIALPGSRDLLAAKAGAGVDVLYVQRWLTLHRDAKKAPYVAAVTGKWDAASRRALERFRIDHVGRKADFATVVAALAGPPKAVVPSPRPASAAGGR